MNQDESRLLTRRNVLRSFAASGLVAAAPVYANAAGVLRGAGDIRKVSLRNDRTGEALDLIYWVEGNYVKDAMAEINYFFRDWRQNKMTNIDPHTIDIIAATHKLMDTSEPYLLLSGYRTRTTNNRLRGAASNSYHVRGMASDVRLRSRSTKQLSRAAHSVGGGGVGTYYGSSFVHMDSGPVRSWRG